MRGVSLARRWGSAVLIVIGLGAGCKRGGSTTAADAGVALLTAVEEPAPAERRVMTVTTGNEEARQLFLEARRLVEDNRESEALPGLRKAVELDPGFALGRAYLGYYSSGGEGLRDLEEAVRLSAQLPEAERQFIHLLMAYRTGDAAQASKTVRALLKAAPEEWRASLHLGNQAYEQRDWTLAIAAYRRTMELADTSPTCVGYNNLGYAQAMGSHFELALAALKRCTDLQPDEPNPHDSVGEVALAAGQLDEAEASFRRALAKDPRFFYAWEGIAAVRYYRGDGAGAAEAIAQAHDAAITPEDRAEVDVLAAWILLANEGQPGGALEVLARMEREAQALGMAGLYDFAEASLHRSAILLEAGRAKEALSEAEKALSRATATGMPEAFRLALQRRARVRKLRALLALGRVDDAAAVLSRLEAAGKGTSGAELSSTLDYARGLLARARGDLAFAQASLSRCQLFGLTERTHDTTIKPEDPFCLWELSEVQRQAKDAAGAEKTRALIAQTLHRDPFSMYVWRQVKRAPATAAAATTP